MHRVSLTYHSGVGILRPVTESRGQSARAALVVMGVLTVVDRAVDADGPHTRGVSIAIAVVVLAAVARGPHVYVTQAIPSLRIKEHRVTKAITRLISDFS